MNYRIIFMAGMCVVVPIAAFLSYIAHVRQLTSRNRIGTHERERLARDLRDTLLQGVQSLKVQSLRAEGRIDIDNHEAMLGELAEALGCGHPTCFESKASPPCRQRERIAPISLDPITGLARNQSRRDDLASIAARTQLTRQAVTARTRLVHNQQFTRRTAVRKGLLHFGENRQNLTSVVRSMSSTGTC
jgi:hypothetical protein